MSVLVLGVSLVAQTVLEDPEVEGGNRPDVVGDPYRGAEALGYVSVKPVWWTRDVGAADVTVALGGWPLIWVDTTHFRIASGWGPRPLPNDSGDRRVIREDLAALRRRLPTVPADVTELDPWLQVHLAASWLETLYRQVEEGLGEPPARFAPLFRGMDSLGAGERVGVLLLERAIDLRRYAKAMGLDEPRAGEPLLHRASGMHVVALTAEDVVAYRDMLQLRQHLVFHASRALLRAAWGGGGGFPLWWEHGMGSWFQRRWHEDSEELPWAERRLERHLGDPWDERVRARARNRAVPNHLEIFEWRDRSDLDRTTAALCWSRAAFLMTRYPDSLGAFVAHCKGVDPDAFSSASPARVAFANRHALLKGYDLTLEEFDTQWQAWARQ